MNNVAMRGRLSAMPSRILGALLILSLAGASAEAQFVGTPESAYLQGVGIAAQGMGSFNLQTAQANQINTETFIRWNEYVNAVMRTQAREAYERRAARGRITTSSTSATSRIPTTSTSSRVMP